MFRHLLIATDGSRLSLRGVRAGMRLAKALRAKVTGLHVALPYLPLERGRLPYYARAFPRGQLENITAKQAVRALKPLLREAKKAGVRCTARSAIGGQPWQAILRAARTAGCDAIVMASHGRSGIGGLVLGSETTQVLARSKIPVLVVR